MPSTDTGRRHTGAELTRLPTGYPALLEELKARIRTAQLRAALTLNQETIRLYWSIGQDFSSRFAAEGWGTKVVDRLAEFTSQVEWRPMTVRKKMPHNTYCQPAAAPSAVMGAQCHRLIHTWNLSLRRSGTNVWSVGIHRRHYVS